MNDSRRLLQHILASLAYRTQKALRGAPDGFESFRAGTNVRTPHELLWHMTGVIGYARTMLHGGQLAMLRRLAGSPVASENFIFARIEPANVSAAQAEPAAPDSWWRPDQPPMPPGQRPPISPDER